MCPKAKKTRYEAPKSMCHLPHSPNRAHRMHIACTSHISRALAVLWTPPAVQPPAPMGQLLHPWPARPVGQPLRRPWRWPLPGLPRTRRVLSHVPKLCSPRQLPTRQLPPQRPRQKRLPRVLRVAVRPLLLPPMPTTAGRRSSKRPTTVVHEQQPSLPSRQQPHPHHKL